MTSRDYRRRRAAEMPTSASRPIAAGSGAGVELVCMSSNTIDSPGGPLGKLRFPEVNSTLLTGMVLVQPNYAQLFTCRLKCSVLSTLLLGSRNTAVESRSDVSNGFPAIVRPIELM